MKTFQNRVKGSNEYEDGKVTSMKGSWQAGVNGAQPGIVKEAPPKVGDTSRREYDPGEAEELGLVKITPD